MAITAKPDFEIAELLHTSWLTVLRTRHRFVEYRREGTCNLFMFLQPLAGWRHAKVTDQRTKQDFAWCMQDLVETHFPEAEKIRVVDVRFANGDKLKKLYPVREE